VIRHLPSWTAGSRLARALRPRRLATTAALLAAAALALWLLVRVVADATVHSTTPTHAASPTAHAPTVGRRAGVAHRRLVAPRPPVPLGVYAGPGSVATADAFGAAAGAPVPYAFDYLDGTSWQTIDDPRWFLERWDGSGFKMIWGVPMLPSTGGATMAAGAAGLYDGYFSTLAQVLVANGQANSLIALGWDPNDASVPWAATSAQAARLYVAYWRQVVTTMRSVAGQQFLFVWDDAAGSGVAPDTLYPGDTYVDLVATDAFDVGLGLANPSWSELASAAYGPDWFAAFAAQHHKPFMIAKWGVVPTAASGGGDDPTFVRQFLAWAAQEGVVMAVAWDDGSWALAGGSFPRSAQMLRTAEADAPAPLARAVGA